MAHGSRCGTWMKQCPKRKGGQVRRKENQWDNTNSTEISPFCSHMRYDAVVGGKVLQVKLACNKYVR